MPSAGEFAGGDGTAEDPFQITTVGHLNNIRCHPSAAFVLRDDIAVPEDVRLLPIGTEQLGAPGCPDSPFEGQLEGEGHAICGLILETPAQDTPVGLFGVMHGGSINELTLSGLQADAGSAGAGALVGQVVGLPNQRAQLTNIAVSGVLVSGGPSGGIVGSGAHVDLRNVHFEGRVLGAGPVGGIAGALTDASVVEAEVTETTLTFTDVLDGREPVGGIVGQLTGTSGVVSFTVQAEMLGPHYIGGVVGLFNAAGGISHGYTAGTITALNGRAGHFGGIVGHYLTGAGLDGVFTLMEFVDTHEDSTGAIIGRYDERPPGGAWFYLQRLSGPGCFGAANEATPLCTRIPEHSVEYFYSPGNSPMSSWQGGVWEHSLVGLPELANTPRPRMCAP